MHPPPKQKCIGSGAALSEREVFVCGGGEIRTPEELSPLLVFETSALDQLCDPSFFRGKEVLADLIQVLFI